MYCKVCGKENDETSLFCKECEACLTHQDIFQEENTNENLMGEKSFGVEQYQKELLKNGLEEDKRQNLELKSNQKNKRHKGWIIGVIILSALVGIGVKAYFSMNEDAAVEVFKEEYTLGGMVGFEANYGEVQVGDIYFQPIGKEKTCISAKMGPSDYAYSLVSGAIAYNDCCPNLCVQTSDGETKVLEENVQNGDLRFSENGQYLYQQRESQDYSDTIEYIYNINSGKMCVSYALSDLESYPYHYFNDKTGIFSYVDSSHKLYEQKEGNQKREIATNIESYVCLDDDTYLCHKVDGIDEYYILLHVLKERIDEERLEEIANIDLNSKQVAEKQQFICFRGGKEENEMNKLYIKIEEQQPVELVDDVIAYTLSKEGNSLYYQDSKNQLHQITLPKLNKKCYKDVNYFKKKLEVIKDEIIFEKCIYYQSAPSGNVLLVYNNEEMYICTGKKTFELDEEIEAIQVFDESIVYSTTDQKLCVREGLTQEDFSILEEPKVLTEHLEQAFETSPYGQYIFYVCKENAEDKEPQLNYYTKEEGIKTVLKDADIYDQVTFGPLTYIRYMKYEDIVGSYCCEEQDFLMKFLEDGTIKVYAAGEEQDSVKPGYESRARDELSIFNVDGDAEQWMILALNPAFPDRNIPLIIEGCTRIVEGADGQYCVYVEDYVEWQNEYIIKRISDDEFNQKLQEQKEKEVRRKAEEEARRKREEEERIRREEEQAKRQYLESLATSYYRNGVYLSSNSLIYDRADYSYYSGYYTSSAAHWNVYDYYIDYDHEVIWVEIVHRPNNSYGSRYGWVPIT